MYPASQIIDAVSNRFRVATAYCILYWHLKCLLKLEANWDLFLQTRALHRQSSACLAAHE